MYTALAETVLPLLPSVNHDGRYDADQRHMLPSKAGRAYRTRVAQYVTDELGLNGRIRPDELLGVAITLLQSDRRLPDLDNDFKGLLNAMQPATATVSTTSTRFASPVSSMRVRPSVPHCTDKLRARERSRLPRGMECPRRGGCQAAPPVAV